jgi:hypothetical protein
MAYRPPRLRRRPALKSHTGPFGMKGVVFARPNPRIKGVRITRVGRVGRSVVAAPGAVSVLEGPALPPPRPASARWRRGFPARRRRAGPPHHRRSARGHRHHHRPQPLPACRRARCPRVIHYFRMAFAFAPLGHSLARITENRKSSRPSIAGRPGELRQDARFLERGGDLQQPYLGPAWADDLNADRQDGLVTAGRYRQHR